MTTQQSVDQAKTEAFLGKVLSDTSGLTTTIMASIGDRLGLFKQLAHGPATSAQLATRAAINERYAREWLGAMASAGYVEYDPASERFTLPAEHMPVLAQEHGPIFLRQHRHVLRSEEHTSELQSRSDLVCRLLLEKKKKNTKHQYKKKDK